jgi:hypothetical protein
VAQRGNEKKRVENVEIKELGSVKPNKPIGKSK